MAVTIMNFRLSGSFRLPLCGMDLPANTMLAVAVLAALEAPVAAQLQFEDLGKGGLSVDAGRTRATALGDVDGDGDPDLAVSHWNSPIRLYLNNGEGTFADATATRMPVGSIIANALFYTHCA